MAHATLFGLSSIKHRAATAVFVLLSTKYAYAPQQLVTAGSSNKRDWQVTVGVVRYSNKVLCVPARAFAVLLFVVQYEYVVLPIRLLLHP